MEPWKLQFIQMSYPYITLSISISNYILASIPKYFALKDSKGQIRIVLGYVLGN